MFEESGYAERGAFMKGLLRLTVAWVLAVATSATAQVESGPRPAPPGQPPVKMPHAFDAHTFNGRAANRFHCMVCENDIHPSLIVFIKDPAAGNEKALEDLFAKLDRMIEKYQAMDQYPEVTTFAAFAVFLDPAAQTSLSKPGESDPAALVKEATDRRALYQRMRAWADKTKKVVVAVAIPEAVKGYNINPEAAVTAIFYHRLNVVDNFAFADFTQADAEAIVQRVEMRLESIIDTLDKRRKKTAGK